MTDKRKSRPLVAQETGQAETACEARFPECDCITAAANRQPGGKIWALLPEGEALAVPAADLAALTGYSPRALRATIDKLRAQGVPVLASDNGYYRPAPGTAGLQEVKRFLRRQDSRCAANRRVVAPLRRMLRAAERGPLDGQMTIGEEDGDGTAQNVQP